jgi:hypothetical protein
LGSFTLRAIALSALCLLAECTEAPLPSADYAPPTAAEALRAVADGVKADHLDRPYKIARLNREARNPGERWTQFENDVARSENERNARMHADLIRIEDLQCKWARVANNDIPKESRERLKDPPTAAYQCSFRFRYRRDPNLGELMAPQGTGFFFKGPREFAYFGPYNHPY